MKVLYTYIIIFLSCSMLSCEKKMNTNKNPDLNSTNQQIFTHAINSTLSNFIKRYDYGTSRVKYHYWISLTTDGGNKSKYLLAIGLHKNFDSTYLNSYTYFKNKLVLIKDTPEEIKAYLPILAEMIDFSKLTQFKDSIPGYPITKISYEAPSDFPVEVYQIISIDSIKRISQKYYSLKQTPEALKFIPPKIH